MSISNFENELKTVIKPVRYKHNDVGQNYSNILLTQLRTGMTNLNLNDYTIGLINKPKCLCHSKNESSDHYLFDCFLYTPEPQTLFNLAEHFMPNFLNISKLNINRVKGCGAVQ